MAKKLVKGEKKLFGVCSGLANYLDVDPTVIRILFVLAFLGFGVGLLVYIVMAFVIPDQWDAFPTGKAAATGAATPPDAAQPEAAGGPVPQTRWEMRRARRAARRASRRHGDDRLGLAIGGAVLILVGAWFLLREWFPGLDFDWVWPGILIATGVLIVVFSLARHPERPRGAG